MFLNGSALTLLLMVPVLAVFLLWRIRLGTKRLQRVGHVTLVSALTHGTRPYHRYALSGLWLLAVVSVIVALARPTWGINDSLVDVEGIAIMVVLDVSASMNAQDVLPSRLERAKLAIRTLFEEGSENLLGLILFAGNAFVQFPLTADAETAMTFLNAANTDSITRQGTVVGEALQLALDAFDERIASHSIIVLMTDGENHEGDPLEVAADAASNGVAVHVIGYGSPEGAPIPLLGDHDEVVGYKTDSAGNVVLSRLDETMLQEIADITGGIYQRASESGIEVIDLLQTIDEVERGILERRAESRRVERFEWFVALAVVALLAEMLLPGVRARQL